MAQLASAYGQLPVSFEANEGQTNSQVKFLSRGGKTNLFLASTEAVLSTGSGKAVRMKLVHSNRKAQAVGVDQLLGKSNYFLGNDPTKWHANVPTYGKVRYTQVYPGIDLVYYGNQAQLEYDFVVAPGADLNEIRIAIQGGDSLLVDKTGNLTVRRNDGDIQMRKPRMYQHVDGREVEVDGRYRLKGRELGFTVGTYDHGHALIIDPVIAYATYLGGHGAEIGSSIAVDSLGNVYIVGYVGDPTFPTVNPLQTYAGGRDVVISKLNSTGTTLIYSTYLGGSLDDTGFAIAVDSLGSAYVTGETVSVDFPTTAGAFQTQISAAPDGFVTKLSPDGSSLVYSTYLGGSANDNPFAIAVDSSGNAYVAGETQSANFPTVASALHVSQPSFCDPTIAGGFDAFIVKFNPDGQSLAYSLYLGGSGTDRANGVAVDSSGNAYVTGNTDSTNFLAGACPNSLSWTNPGGTHGFVVKVNPGGTAFLYASELGGSGTDVPTSIAVNGAGQSYVAGATSSANFGSGNAGSFDAFVAGLDSSGHVFMANTIGGSGFDAGRGVAFDSSGNVYITGETNSTNFPVLGAFQSTYGGGSADVYVAEFSSTGSLLFSTYLGGSGSDTASIGGTPIAVDAAGNIYVGGSTTSTDFPGVNAGSFQPINQGSSNEFIVKLGSAKTPTTTTVVTSVGPSVFGQQVSFTATVSPAGPSANIPTGSVTFNDGATNLGNGTSGGNGVWVFSTTAPLSVATHLVTASYSGDSNFSASTSAALAQTVNQAASTIALTASPNPSIFGQAVTLTATVSAVAPGAGTPSTTVTFFDAGASLGPGTLNGGQAILTPAPLAGPHSFSAVYGGDVNFLGSSSTSVSDVVTKATPPIVWAAPAPIVFGTPLSSTQLNASSPLGGSFAYTPPANTVLGAGTQTLSVTFTPADTADYTTATATVSITVGKATPTISWTAPAAILAGTPLTGAQLNATASVAGAFAYSPAAGALLPAGVQTLSTSFTPNDGADNTTASASVLLVVDQPPAILSPATATFTEVTAGSFSFQTSGFPLPALTETGSLPAGLLFTDNGSGTATLSGSPAAGTAGNYSITITAANGIGANATQSFTLTVAPALPIYSGNSTTFTAGIQGLFLVGTTGTPVPAFTETGKLPLGLTLIDNGNGTATISGTPGPNTAATYPIVVQASNSNGATGSQNFTLTVNPGGPAILTGNITTFTVGSPGTFTIESSGFPVAALMETGALPRGVTFTDNGDGTATLSGTPTSGAAGTYSFIISANNVTGGPAASQSFTLFVNSSQGITSTNTASFVDQAAGSFTITALGKPVPALTETGLLPNGVTFTDNGNGSATLIGTPAAGSSGLYGFTVRAGNGVVPDAIQTFLLSIKSTTAVDVSSPTSLVPAGLPVSLTATLSVVTAGVGVPAPGGTITFFDSGAALGSAMLGGAATATLTTSTLAPGTHSITVQYSGDFNYSASTSPAAGFQVTIIKSPTSVNIAAPTPSTAFAGQQVTLTANLTVGVSGASVPPPGGTITFLDGAVSLGTAPVVASTGTGTAAGSASLMISTLAAGTHSINVQYRGDPNYFGSSGGGFLITIMKSPTSVSVAAPPTPGTALAGQQVMLTANLTVGVSGASLPAPGGTITFLDGTVSLGTAPLVSSTGTGTLADTATLPISTLAAGIHSINVQYSGDPNYFGSNGPGGGFSITIIKSGTSVSVAAPPTPSAALAAQQVMLTANLFVGPTGPGVPPPSGTITFLDGTVPLGTAPLVSSIGTGTLTDTATLTISTLAAGIHSISVQYSGDPNYFGSTSPPPQYPLTIQNTPTGRVSVQPVAPNTGTSPVTLTFSGGVTQAGLTSLTISPTGPVTPSGFAVGTPTTYFNLSTTAVFTPPITVCINYTGISFPANPPALFHYENGMWVNVTTSVDPTNMIVCGSVSSLSPFAVFAPLPVLTITGNNAARRYGQANPTFGVSYSGFLNGDGPSSLSGSLLCSSPATPASSVGSYPITCFGLTSSKYTIMYAPGVLTTTPAPLTVAAANQQRVFGSANPVLTGTIAGTQNGDNITATYTTVATPASPVGVYAIVPSLVDPSSKLGNYAVTMNNGTLTVMQASTTIGLSVTPNPSTFGQSVTLSATVAPLAPGAGTPTGTVTFRDGSVTLGTSTLGSTDKATFTTSSLAAGNHSLAASYGGDASFIGSASSAVSDQVLCGVLISVSPSSVPVGGTTTVTGKVISCSTTTEIVTIKFALSGPSQPNSCSSTKSAMFTTPPFPLVPNTSQTVSFPFKVPGLVCPGTYSITSETLVNGVAVDTSTASLTITAR